MNPDTPRRGASPASGVPEPGLPMNRLRNVRLVQSTILAALFVGGVRHEGRAAEPDTTSISFRHDVLPVLTKYGCNSGACHGSPSGKGGFSLSMMAYDPVMDERILIRESWNRRLNLQDPGASLLLRKATLKAAHGGGQRFEESEPGYRVLTEWIRQGARSDLQQSPQLTGILLESSQTNVVQHPHWKVPLRITAHFADRTSRDVTELASFSSSDPTIAVVNRSGVIQGHAMGEVAISVRYLEQVESITLTFVKVRDGFEWSQPGSNNRIDDLVHEQLRLLQILPSGSCDDAVFLRRVCLDVTGQLPTAELAREFLKDDSKDKRQRMIDLLLESDRHAGFWGQKLADLLQVNSSRLTEEGARRYHAWLVESVASNRPFNVVVRELLTAGGNTYEVPAANYYRAAADTNAVTESTAQLFLGIRISCAKCHNHPFERWTQDNYYGIAAFFDRVTRTGGDKGAQTIAVRDTGEVRHPRTGVAVQPWLPLAGSVKVEQGHDRRQVFADWLTTDENEFLAPVFANRLWAELMGQGIVDPVDDFRSSNPPANSRLLEFLASECREHGFDRRHLLRLILNSRTYQRSHLRNEWNLDDTLHFSAFKVHRLTAEQLLDAVSVFCGVDEEFPQHKIGTRATELAMPVSSEFLETFGQPRRETACQCERESEPTLDQALLLLNGPTVQNKLSNPQSRLHRLLDAGTASEKILEELYLAAFARYPTQTEHERAMQYVKTRDDARQAWEDVAWALINSREFIFQH